MEKKRYNKLVRDKIPDVIKVQGGLPITKVLNDEDYLQAVTAWRDYI